MPRSLTVRQECLTTVKSSLLRNGFPSQKILAEALGIAQSTVSNFLNGKPVDYVNFIEICGKLGKEWRDLADLSDKSESDEIQIPGCHILMSNLESDRPPASLLLQQLQPIFTAAGHEIFVANHPTKLREYLQESDYFLLLVTQQTVVSELAIEAIQLALELQAIASQKPAIFPLAINLADTTILSFDLLQLLADIPVWQWQTNGDTRILATELLNLFKAGRTALPSQHPFAIAWQKLHFQNAIAAPPLPAASPEVPEGQVEIASRFYLERPPIETRAFEVIAQPGALIRIKAPRQMGKTSLMARILSHAEQTGSSAIALSFQLANKRILKNSDTFLQWFCASIGQELGLLEQVAQCWQLADLIGSNQCCKAYFEQYILPTVPYSLTLGLDEVDRVFESPEIADDFFGLLRALHEEAKRRDLWKKLRVIVVHSTEVYIPLDINKSPFNVGLPLELPEFNFHQVQELTQRHHLSCNAEEITQLMTLVGGHPYLVRLALYHISRQDITLSELIKTAATESGIYADHLRRHLWNLEKYPELSAAFKTVVNANNSIRLSSTIAFKLNSMGLVKLTGNDCVPRCELYAEYFHSVL